MKKKIGFIVFLCLIGALAYLTRSGSIDETSPIRIYRFKAKLAIESLRKIELACSVKVDDLESAINIVKTKDCIHDSDRKELLSNISSIETDPFGNKSQIVRDKNSSIGIKSFGKDSLPGGDDENADFIVKAKKMVGEP